MLLVYVLSKVDGCRGLWGVKRGVLGPSNEKWKREQWLGWGKLGEGGRWEEKKRQTKKPPSKFDTAAL